MEQRHYDVFLSHNSADKGVVELIARQLQGEYKLAPFLDKWNLIPGTPWMEALEDALQQSNTIAVLIGPSGVSPWHNEEMRVAINKAVSSHNEYRVIPVLLPGAEEKALPDFLTRRTWVDFRSGLDNHEQFARLVAGIKGEPLQTPDFELPDEPAPYRGLARFEAPDTRFFFGRQEERTLLIKKLAEHPFVAVVGASGSGKSSLVRAGLIPDLGNGALRDSKHWHTLLLTPGDQPLRTLATQLATVAPLPNRLKLVDELEDILKKRDDGLLTAYTTLFAENPKPLLLVIDQFEQIFSHRPQDTVELWQQEVERFFVNLTHAARHSAQRVYIVITLRADFLDDCLHFPTLKSLLQDHQLLLGPLNESALREAIVRPAQEVHAYFQTGLVGTILRDVQAQPNALPLLQQALSEVWKRRRGPWLTFEGYEESGGVHGALRHCANDVYRKLDNEQRELARTIFLRLVSREEGVRKPERVRYAGRRVLRAELYPVGVASEKVDAVLQVLSGAEARLIMADQETVELTHDSLIVHWNELQAWLREEDEDFDIHRRLTLAAQQWGARKRREEFLYRGKQLEEVKEWRDKEKNKKTQNPLEKTFIDRSIRLRNRILSIVTATAVLMAILFVATLWQSARVEYQRKVARVGEFVAKAELERTQEPDKLPVSVLYAVRANSVERIQEPPNFPEPVGSRGTAILPDQQSDSIRMPRFVSRFFAFAERIFIGEVDVSSAEISLHRGLSLLARPVGPRLFEGRVADLAFCLHGTRLAVVRKNMMHLWEVTDRTRPKELSPLEHPADINVTRVACSVEGNLLATAGGNTVYIWNLTNGQREEPPIPHDDDVQVTALAFNVQGTYLAIGGGKAVQVWQMANSRQVRLIKDDSDVTAVALSPDGANLAVARGKEITVIGISGASPFLRPMQHEAVVNAVAFNHDGSLLATGSKDHTARIWQRDGSELVRFPHGRQGQADIVMSGGHFSSHGDVRDVTFSSEGRYLATASTDRTARVWEFKNITGGREFLRLPHKVVVDALAFAPDGNLIATASPQGVQLWEVSRGDEVVRLNHTLSVLNVEFSRDNAHIVTTDESKTKRLWDAHSGREVPNTLPDTSKAVSSPSTDTYEAKKLDDGKTVEIREKASGKKVASIVHEGGVNQFSFDPKGTLLATAGSDGTARIWRWRREDLVKEACARLTPYLNRPDSDLDPEMQGACHLQ